MPRPECRSSVSVEDLACEIQRHVQSPHVPVLLEELRNRTLDLKAFCTRVRQLLGADVLMKTVKGLQEAQKRKKELADGACAGSSSISPCSTARHIRRGEPARWRP